MPTNTAPGAVSRTACSDATPSSPTSATCSPTSSTTTLAPYVADGRAELVAFAHQLMMNLAALTAGVDRPAGTPEESFHLYDYLTTFIEGATLAHYTGDRDAKAAEVQEKLERFDAEFLAPGIERRTALLDAFAAGEIDEDDAPPRRPHHLVAQPGQDPDGA